MKGRGRGKEGGRGSECSTRAGTAGGRESGSGKLAPSLRTTSWKFEEECREVGRLRAYHSPVIVVVFVGFSIPLHLCDELIFVASFEPGRIHTVCYCVNCVRHHEVYQQQPLLLPNNSILSRI